MKLEVECYREEKSWGWKKKIFSYTKQQGWKLGKFFWCTGYIRSVGALKTRKVAWAAQDYQVLVLLPTLQRVWLHLHKILCHTHPYYVRHGSRYPLGKLGPLQPSNMTFCSTRIYAGSLRMYCKGTVHIRTLSCECGGNKPDTDCFWDFHHAHFLLWHSGQTQIKLFFLHILKSVSSFYYPYCENFHSGNQ